MCAWLMGALAGGKRRAKSSSIIAFDFSSSTTSSETSPSMRVLSRARPLFSAALSMMRERPYCSCECQAVVQGELDVLLVRQHHHHHQSPEVAVGLVYFTTKFL